LCGPFGAVVSVPICLNLYRLTQSFLSIHFNLLPFEYQ
jgi:hypothetical protein